MTDCVARRLESLLDPEGIERDPAGLPRAVPASAEVLAAVCATARGEGWRVRVEGRGSWLPADAPSDFALSTRRLNRIVGVSPADLVATAEAGATLAQLRADLAPHRLWLALDPPGVPERSIGSIAATGTAGPLRHGFGPVRDHVLGCTVCTGDGRLITSGGRVVKNVAGYDLTKLHLGGFGGFGILTQLHLRLRAEPEADLTLLARGRRPELVTAALAAVEAQVDVGTLELFSPAFLASLDWTLAARILGPHPGVEAEAARLAERTGRLWERLTQDQAAEFWSRVARAPLGGPVAVRLGGLLDGLEDLADLVVAELGDGLLSAGMGTGALRWIGDPPADRVLSLRRRAAEREVPVTLERGPWPFRRVVGHFGDYREGVGTVVGRLRDAFDPGRVIAAALEAEVGSGR
jgi:glycolate oxidase FAD binding subunit